MATLVLDRVWINLLATGEPMNAFSNDRSRAMAVDTEVRTYGGGRRRAVTAVGRVNTMSVTLRWLNVLQVVNLEKWLGLPVMYRDYRGQRFVGVYGALKYTEHKQADRWDVAFDLEEVTWVEGVA